MGSVDYASTPLRNAVKGADNELVRALARERGFICEAPRILSTPYATLVRAAKPPGIVAGGPRLAIGFTRTLSRIARDTAHADKIYLRVFDKRYGRLMKCSLAHGGGMFESGAKTPGSGPVCSRGAPLPAGDPRLMC